MSGKLRELARPFPDKFVHKNPSGGGDYVKHHVVNQRLIQVLGKPPDFSLVEIVRGDVAAKPPDPQGKSKRAREGSPPLSDVVVGVVARLTVDLDGETHIYEEAGDCEDPHNWPHDGGRLKDAMSDAYKRCAMRLGCGLHLWSQDEYFLFNELAEATSPRAQSGGESSDSSESHPREPTARIQAASPQQQFQQGPRHVVPSSPSPTPPRDSAAPAEPSADPSSAKLLAEIERAIQAGDLKKNEVLVMASHLANTLKVQMKPYLRWNEMPKEFLERLVEKLGLGVKA